jgi:hypothetical protein
MNGAKFGSISLMLLFAAMVLVPVLAPQIASADCGGACVRDYDRCAHCVYEGDLLRCGSCNFRDYDRGSIRDCDTCFSEYRCNLYHCGWIN